MANSALSLADRHFLVAAILTAPQIDSGDGPKAAVRKFNETLAELGKSDSRDHWTEGRRQRREAPKDT